MKTNNRELKDFKGHAVLQIMATIYCYIVMDLFDKKLNLNIINMSILSIILALTAFILAFYYRAAKKIGEQKLASNYAAKGWRPAIWILTTYTFILVLTIVEHNMTLEISGLYSSIISLVILLIIIVTATMFRLWNFLIFCSVLTFIPVLSQLSFVPELVRNGLFILIFIIAAYVYIKTTKTLYAQLT